jgi:hypothetical protein
MSTKKYFLVWAAIGLGVLLVSCSLSGGSSTDAISAKLVEVSGGVELKQQDQADYATAEEGINLGVQGQVRTQAEGQAKLEISDGSIVRLGPDSLFSLQALESQNENVFLQVELLAGEIWIILQGGEAEVNTPSGMAAVRGSYMSVSVDEETGEVVLTCLEGDCRVENGAASVDLVAGQKAIVTNLTQPPQKDRISAAEIERWLQQNPEATVVVPALTQTAEALGIEEPTSTPTVTATLSPTATSTATSTATPTASSTPTLVPTEESALLGPDLEDFPPGVNPLTGLPVSDPANLNLPAVLISITNFPVSARPQAGLSFAPYIFELFISEGMTRFLTLFYGDFPRPEFPVSGDCAIRTEPFEQGEGRVILGNYVWLDGDENGVQDIDELPVSGVCVNLYDAETDELIASTSTDSNGYYGFNVELERSYYLKFPQPTGKTFTSQDVGADDYADSDVDPDTGTTPAITLANHDFSWDAGLVGGAEEEDGSGVGDGDGDDGGEGGEQGAEAGGDDDQGGEGGGDGEGGEDQDGQEEQGSEVETEQDQEETTTGTGSVEWLENPGLWIGNWIGDVVIGPVRSGRLPYRWIRDWYYQACLIYAGKSEYVDIPGCASVFGSDETDINSAFMSVERLREIAKQSKTIDSEINYSGNTYLNTNASNGVFLDGTGLDGSGVDGTGGEDDGQGGGLFPAGSTKPDGSPYPYVPGAEAQKINVFYNFYNQALWRFDPLSGGYLRYTDWADGSGEFYPATDRLNGRQLIFHNIIILFADHTALSPTIIDVDLSYTEGRAILFRDGRAYKIVWRTFGEEYAKETGLSRPIKFIDSEGNPVPLHPGQTWVHIVSNISLAWEKEPGFWKVRFYAPPGTK